MAYITAADFRIGSLAEFCAGLDIGDEVSEAVITSAIARLSARFDRLTDDHFESRSVVYTLNGSGGRMQSLPERCTAVATLKTKNIDGTQTTQTSTTYRLVSSLNVAGDTAVAEFDYLEVAPYQYFVSVTGGGFPYDSASVEVTGSFGWPVTPADVKRGVALMTYDAVKPARKDLLRVDRFSTADTSFDLASTTPTGIPEADAIILDFHRDARVSVG